jgi:hypothetical protein
MWEGIELRAPAELAWAAGADQAAAAHVATGMPSFRRAPRLIVTGRYMARPSILAAAPTDWAFGAHATPMIVMIADDDGPDHGPPDDTSRVGAPIAVDVGFYVPASAAPRLLRLHAELGPLRSAEVRVRVLP